MKLAALPEVVQSLRADRGWSQTDLAQKAGLSRNTIARLENGTDTNLTLDTLAALFGALGLEVDVRVKKKGYKMTDLCFTRLDVMGYVVVACLAGIMWGYAIALSGRGTRP